MPGFVRLSTEGSEMRAVPPVASEDRVRIGDRIRAARHAQGLSLAQVADATGLTKGFLSRVERDETSPSVASLVQLCQVLSIPVGALFAEPVIQLVRLDDAPRINLGGEHVVERLLSTRTQERVQVIRSTMTAGATGGASLYTIASEIAVVHVLEGSLELRFVDRTWRLVAGDTATYPGREPHSWDAPDGAEVIWTLAPAAWSGSA